MNLLADESVEKQIVDHLRFDGHDVYFIQEMEAGIDDDMVLARANERDALLLTGDKDFGEMVFRQRLIHTGVILVRLSGLQPDTKGIIVATVVREREGELSGAFAVITPGMVRIRQRL